MAFRKPEERSNRQPGIREANERMPLTAPRDMKGPRPFLRQDIEQLPEYFKPIGRPGMGNYQNMGGQSTDPRERYIANTQGGHPSMSQYGYRMPNSGIMKNIMGMGSSMMEALPMAYIPGGYDDDDYGSFIPDSVIEMDLLEGMYGPEDEYNFDKSKGFENRIFGIDPQYFRGGIASLMR